MSTFQVCRLCANPLPHEYDVPLVTVADTGQNPIAATTTTTSPTMRSTTCCGPDNWCTTLPGQSRVSLRMDTRSLPGQSNVVQTDASRNAAAVSAVAFFAASKMLSSP